MGKGATVSPPLMRHAVPESAGEAEARTERVEEAEGSAVRDAREAETEGVDEWLSEARSVRERVGVLEGEAVFVTAASASHSPKRPAVGKGATEGLGG